MGVISFLSLFNNSDKTMTEEKVLLKNWERNQTKIKDLIDLGFAIPEYSFYREEWFPIKDFDDFGLKIVLFG
jgi:hypothetical protein